MRVPRISPGSTQLRTRSQQTIRPEGLDTSGKGLSTIGKAVEGIGDEMYNTMNDARNYVEGSQFALIQAKKEDVKNNYANATTKDKNDRIWSSTDTPENRKALEAELKAIDDESYKVFTNKDQELKAKGLAALNSISTISNVKAAWMKNLARNGQAATSIFYDNITSSFTGSEDQINAINARANADIKNNISTPEVARNDAKTALRTGWNNLFLTDLNTNPALANKRLAANFYKMSVVDREKAERVYSLEIDRIHSDNGEILDQQAFDGTLNEATIKNFVTDGRITSKEGTSRIKTLNAVDAKSSDPFIYNSLLERGAEVGSMAGWGTNAADRADAFSEATKLRIDVLDARTKGSLSKEEAGEILGEMGNRFKNFDPYKKGVLQLKEFADVNYTPEEKDIIKREIYATFMGLVRNGTDPVDAVNQAKQNLYPQYNYADLIFTAHETGLTVQKVVELMDKKSKETK